ncbi:hypothetical protein MPSEU_000409600 [Mayamaea pseudoterrestris]|nr:hypothetical protein MPSEU_000409600 [Mayamaea pseudoterrestris]
MSSASVPGRLNGFSRPYSPAQIAAWTALIVTSLEFVMIISPILPVAASVIITLMYMSVVGLVIYYGGQTQIVDPMDPYLAKFLQETRPPSTTKLYRYFNPLPPTEPQQPSNVEEQAIDNEESLKQCWLCDLQVKTKSMHCKFCNKCIDEFDHHCMWLNTCIGKPNYHLFYRTMLALLLMLCMHFVISVAVVSASANVNGATRLRMQAWGNPNLAGSPVPGIRTILIFFIIFDAGSLILLSQLVWFHIGLQKKGLSTYEYIIHNMDVKRERARRDADITSLRIRQVNEAKRDGRNLHATRLILGGFCRQRLGCAACDPLELPLQSEVNGKAPAEQGFALALGSGHVDEDDSIDNYVSEEVEIDTELPEHEAGVTFIQVGNGNMNVPNNTGRADEPRVEQDYGAAATTSVSPANVQTAKHLPETFNENDKSFASTVEDDDAPSDEDSLLNLP